MGMWENVGAQLAQRAMAGDQAAINLIEAQKNQGNPAGSSILLGAYNSGYQPAYSPGDFTVLDQHIASTQKDRANALTGLGVGALALGGAGALGLLGEAGAAGAGAGASEAALGSGLTAAPSTTGVLGTGSLGTAASTAGALGEGALGTGLAVPGGVGTGLGAGASGIAAAAPAGSALAPGFFASEGLGGAGALGAAGSSGGSGAASGAGDATGVGAGALGGAAPLIGAIAPAALGAYGAGQQANAYGNLAGQYMAMGAPYRSRLSDLYNNPDDFLNSKEVQIPIQQGTNILARSLSRGGNPIGSGNALQELQNYASNQLFSRLGQEKDRLAGFGGLTAYNNAAPGAASAEIGAQKGIYDAIGAGAADIFNPPQRVDLNRLLRGY